MQMIDRVAQAARGLWPVFLVAVGVALASTLAGSVVDRVHQVDAEAMVADVNRATPGTDGTQVLGIKEWGIQLTLPLAAEMPLVNYARQSSASVGLSSADLEKRGVACEARSNGLGALLRMPAGSAAAYLQHDIDARFVKSAGAYDYVYEAAANACQDDAVAAAIVNREKTVMYEALHTFEPLGQ